MAKLDGTIAVVTGASRYLGIGRAIALRLAQDGADVAVCGLERRPDQLPPHEREIGWRGGASLAEEIRSLGRRAMALNCDVTQRPQIDSAFDAVVREMGTPTALINNAATPSERGQTSLLDLDEDRWRRTLEVNLTGYFLVAKTAARHMLAAGVPGSIVNVASITGRVPMPNFGAYCVAKFGVIGFTQQLALELADQSIRVNCICPGVTDTDLMKSARQRAESDPGGPTDNMLTALRAGIPMKRISSPQEQAAVVSFLVSPDASYITGQSLNVDGGVRMD